MSGPYGPLDCSTSITDGDGSTTTTLTDLLECTAANAASCYNLAGAGDDNCCGCATDPSNTLATDWPPATIGSSCQGNNPTWAAQAQPLLVYLKQACPTAYTYPFDDPTSTFQCSTTGATNMMGYKVTFDALPTPPPVPTPTPTP